MASDLESVACRMIVLDPELVEHSIVLVQHLPNDIVIKASGSKIAHYRGQLIVNRRTPLSGPGENSSIPPCIL